jgi:cytochrome b561
VHPITQPFRSAHPALIRTLHWLTLGVLLLAFGLVLLRDGLESSGVRQLTLNLHRYVGLLAWAVTLLRLGVRSRLPLAGTQKAAPRWQQWAASAMHGALYLFLLALPFLGLALTNARGQGVTLPLIGSLPAWPEKDLDLADMLESWHATAAWTLAAMVGAHAAIALWHHRVRRDGVLLAMLPQLRRSR